MGPQRMYASTPWVRRLLVANLLVYLLQMTLFTSPHFLDVFGFAPFAALARPWTFVTYMFLHANLLHLAFNLLMLFLFGSAVEDRMGQRAFIGFYFLCGLGGAALSFLLTQVVAVAGPMIGASGAILGVIVAFAWYWPDHPVFVFPLPTPIPAKWLIALLVGVDLVMATLGVSDGVAHLAHLGGAGAGLLYLKSQSMRLSRAEQHLRRATEPSVLVTPAPRVRRGSDARTPKPSRSRGAGTDERANAEIDRVLDKISAKGLESLTPAERKFLTEMSKRMRDRH